MKNYNKRLSKLVLGKAINNIEHRQDRNELFIAFTDGTRLVVNITNDELELSVTLGNTEEWQPVPSATANQKRNERKSKA